MSVRQLGKENNRGYSLNQAATISHLSSAADALHIAATYLSKAVSEVIASEAIDYDDLRGYLRLQHGVYRKAGGLCKRIKRLGKEKEGGAK